MRRAEPLWVESTQRWMIKVQKDGVRRSFYSTKSGTKGKREVEWKADQWLKEGFSGDMRFGELWIRYLKRCEEMTGRSNYMKHEQMGRLWLLPILEHRRVTAITPLMWQSCIDNGYKHGLSKKSCQNIRASIVAACRFARMLLIPVEMPDTLSIPMNAPVKEKNILQPDMLRTLFQEDTIIKYGKHEKAFFINAWRFMVITGLRRGELCGLNKIDLKRPLLDLKRSINWLDEETTGKNTNARRNIVLPDRALVILDEQEAMLKNMGIVSPWVFPDEYGQRCSPKRLYGHWRTYCKQHDIHCNLHELRHTMISVAQADVPEALLKQIVGHSASMDTQGVYGHEVKGDKERAAKLLDQSFNRFLNT